MGRQLRNQRCRRHARLSIDLKADEFAGSLRAVVEPEVGPAYAAASQCVVRIKSQFLDKLVNFG